MKWIIILTYIEYNYSKCNHSYQSVTLFILVYPYFYFLLLSSVFRLNSSHQCIIYHFLHAAAHTSPSSIPDTAPLISYSNRYKSTHHPTQYKYIISNISNFSHLCCILILITILSMSYIAYSVILSMTLILPIVYLLCGFHICMTL